MNPISTIIFDIGRVLYDYVPEQLVKSVLPESCFHELYLQHLFDTPLWLDLDRGVVSEQYAAERIANISGIRDCYAEVIYLLQNFVYHLPVLSESHNLYRQLHADGYPIYLLTNFQEKPFEQLYEISETLQMSVGSVVSAQIKLMKPEPEIYLHLFEKFNLKPTECLFIDDRPENIEAAMQLGMDGIIFTSAYKLESELYRRNLLQR